MGVIMGYVNIFLQVSNHLVIRLERVKVTPSMDY